LPWLAAVASGFRLSDDYLQRGAQILATILFALWDLVLAMAGFVISPCAFFGTALISREILARMAWGERYGLFAGAAAGGAGGLLWGLFVLRNARFFAL